jgi:hypothetical protein
VDLHEQLWIAHAAYTDILRDEKERVRGRGEVWGGGDGEGKVWGEKGEEE